MVWGSAVLWFDGPTSRPLAGLLAGGFALSGALLLVWLRPFGRAVVGFSLLFLVVLLWWLGIEASNKRDWQVDVARLPSATIEGDRVTVSNVRNSPSAGRSEATTSASFAERISFSPTGGRP
jgi:hypothetical protein